MARKRLFPLTVSSFLRLEAELTELRRPDHPLSAKAEEAVEARIRYICDQLFHHNPDPDFGKRIGERVVVLLRKRWRSSGDSLDYDLERNRLLTQFMEVSAQKQKHGSEEHRQRVLKSKAERNEQMALEFLSKRENSHKSNSALMAKIGKQHGLQRSAAITAIKSGLKSLNSPAKGQ
jgi:hypothetical protein